MKNIYPDLQPYFSKNMKIYFLVVTFFFSPTFLLWPFLSCVFSYKKILHIFKEMF